MSPSPEKKIIVAGPLHPCILYRNIRGGLEQNAPICSANITQKVRAILKIGVQLE